MEFQVEEDLPPSLACLKSFDVLLRCPICFDFLNISMMTKCSHNFCSLCIRKYLSYKLQCPVCNAQVVEQDLRNNRLLDELITDFQAARKQLSNANLDSSPIPPRTPASAIKCKTSKVEGRMRNSSVLSHFFQKKLKTSSTEETQLDGSVAPCVQRVAHNANDNGQYMKIVQIPKAEEEEPLDLTVMCSQSLLSVKQEDADSPSPGTWNERTDSLSPLKDEKPLIKVECPVCSVSISQHFINKHLDTCLTSGEKKSSLRSSLGNRRRPMSKLVYNLLSVQELKRKLKECHLSTQGSRDQLAKRHQEFVHIYNAQCDALNPKSEDISKEVEANEKIRNQLQSKNKTVMVFSKNQSEEEIAEMHSNYRKQHSSDFTRLIAQVRGRMESKTHIKQELTKTEEQIEQTNPSDQIAEPHKWVIVKLEDSEAVVPETSTQRISLPASPGYDSCSDVSISSSISDVFGPEPAGSFEDAERTSVQKRTSGSIEEDSGFIPGKRRRKK
ncbi:E3 ubiquitin-protein ligase RAD18 isoform X2 [Thalassophryne amazonica]|uniref:E3 ubiquitin-protein ligase RAD18 isoform X2 n=1 Tax=Thalassophryne amazonica TaxID=390379 RepID=UPI0014726AFD|nr:E3 ubiquitin-protein ligase RAD18 isoform X2 [Thalassophryne amazonica]